MPPWDGPEKEDAADAKDAPAAKCRRSHALCVGFRDESAQGDSGEFRNHSAIPHSTIAPNRGRRRSEEIESQTDSERSQWKQKKENRLI